MPGAGFVLVLLAAQSTVAPAPAPKVSELVVPGGPAPVVSSSFPAQGATIAAGEVAIKVVFDRPMSAGSWGYGPAPGGAFPACLDRPRLLADKKTFVLLCQVQANTTYAMDVGAAPGFSGEAGRAAEPTVLKFATSDQVVDDLHDALDAAGLTDADDPIMTWNDDGKSPPRSAPPPS